MLRWAIIFAILAVVLYLLGFVGVADFLGDIAMLLVWLFVILFVIFLILHLVRGRRL